jgi:hypothetical protein
MCSVDLAITFADFVEFIFEISQEIDVSRNVLTELKFKNYIEKTILITLKYRLHLK